MRNAQLIPAKGEHNVVAFSLRVRVDGNTLTIPSSVQVYGILVTKEVNRIPYAKVLIVDGDSAIQDFEASNEKWFVPGNQIEISMGYLNGQDRLFKGIIIKQNISVRNGSSFLEVECRDIAYRMTLYRQGRYFENKSDSELAAELLSAHGVIPDITATRHTHADLVQYDCTDWDFLVSRMDFNGLLTILDDGIAHIHAPNFNQEPALSLQYGATVIEFDGGLELRDQFDSVVACAWNPNEQAVVEIPAEEPKIKQNGNLPGKELANAAGQAGNTHRHGGNLPEAELQAWANARLLKDRLSRTCGTIKFKGYNAIKPGQIVVLHGFGNRFNGPVYVAAVHHEYLEAGWLTEIEFGLSPKWFAEIVKMEAPKAAGMLPAVNGLQIGLVTQIDDDVDGDGYRVRVRLPILDQQAAGVWARVATLDAGAGRGTFFRPEVNDEVIVGFIHDDPRDAVILGMLHSRDKAAPFKPSKENSEKGFVSREGLRLVFQEKDRSITLETPGGKLILSDKGNGVLLSDKNGNSIELNDKGITLKSKTDINIDAQSNCATQAGAWKVRSRGQANLDASGVTTITGTKVNIN